MKKTLVFLLIIISVTVILFHRNSILQVEFFSILDSDFADEGTKTKKDKKLIVGIASDYPPFSFYRGGKLVGYDLDLACLIAEKLKVELEIYRINFHFDKISELLESNQIDMAISSISIDNERSKQISFSIPYLENKVLLLTKNDRYHESLSLEELKGKIIGVEKGTTLEKYLNLTNHNCCYGKIHVSAYMNSMNSVDQLLHDHIDGILLESNLAHIYATMYPQALKINKLHDLYDNKYAIALSFKSKDLMKKLNQVLQDVKEEGKLEKLSNKWLGKFLYLSR